MFDFSKNWPIYMLVGITLWFFIHVGYKGYKVGKSQKMKNSPKEKGNFNNKSIDGCT